MVFQPNRGHDEGSYRYIGRFDSETVLGSFYYGFIKTFNETMIQQLRAFFETNPRAVCFRDQAGDNNVHIAEAWGTERQHFPTIVVERTDANFQDLFLGNKLGQVFEERPDGTLHEVGEALGGRVRINTSLKIGTFTTPQRDALADLLAYALVGPIYWELVRKAFTKVVNSQSIGGEGTEEVEKIGQTIFTRSISCSFEAEWMDIFFYNGVEITGFKLLLSKG